MNRETAGQDGRQEDARVTRTREALFSALRALLREGAGPSLTISTLCQRARVSRPAFYQHYASLEELLQDSVRRRLEEVLDDSALGVTGIQISSQAQALVTALLDLGASESDLYTSRLGDVSVARRVQSTFEDWVTERMTAAFAGISPVQASFVAGGMSRVLLEWLAVAGGRPGASEFAAELWSLVEPVLTVPQGRGPSQRQVPVAAGQGHPGQRNEADR